MEDLASEFQEHFLEAVKVLEDFSTSDADLRQAMREIRDRIAAKRYVCAPNFWDDLRDTLGAIEQRREDPTAKSKAQLVMKQIARLEVKFWAKESTDMLRELDAESRLERLVDWLQTFDQNDESADQSSGPAVLYAVLSDLTLVKDLEPSQKEGLAAAVRDNLHKFPVEMQAVLERVGNVQSGGIIGRVLQDLRRRSQTETAADGAGGQAPAAAGGTRLAFVPVPKAPALGLGALPGDSGVAGLDMPPQPPAGNAPMTPLPGGFQIPARGPRAAAEDEERDDGEAPQQFNVADVDPEVLAGVKRAVLSLLQSNDGDCPKQHVRSIFKQAGIAGCPVEALGDEVFFSGTEVFIRKAPGKVQGKVHGTALTDELKQLMVSVVRDAGGRITVTHLMERLHWHTGSVRFSTFGPLKKAIGQVPELFYEPKRVFTREAFSQKLAPSKRKRPAAPEPAEDVDGRPMLAGPACVAPEGAPEGGAPAFVADPFAELINTILTWLQQSNGVLGVEAVKPLIKAMGFKTRAVLAAISRDVWWAHIEGDCEILLRTPVGAQRHHKPLPNNYLHKQVHMNLLTHIKNMGAKAKADKLAGHLSWNMRSELRRTYGVLRLVLMGLREVFFDPDRLYLKQALEGIVDWPVGGQGRLGPRSTPLTVEEEALRHWSPQADDLKGHNDPQRLNAVRQLIASVMRSGGRIQAVVLQGLLQQILEGATLQDFFQPGEPHDLSKVLFWSPSQVFPRRAAAIDADASPVAEDSGLPPGAATLIRIAVQNRGVPGASLQELKVSLEEACAREGDARVGDLPPGGEPCRDAECRGDGKACEDGAGGEVGAARPDDGGGREEGAGREARGEGDAGGEARGGGGGGAKEVCIDEDALCKVVQQIPELFFMPEIVFMRHIVESMIIQAPEAPDAAEAGAEPGDEAASAEATLEAVAEAMAMTSSAPALADAPATVVAQEEQGGESFFSFNQFGQSSSSAGEPDPKRARLALPAGTPAAGAAAGSRGRGDQQLSDWGSGAATWATEGAAVRVRSEGAGPDLEGVIVRARGSACTVRLSVDGGPASEHDVAMPSLMPVEPRVGACVKVVVGARLGCCGELVGLAGSSGVVQIGKMSYETLPMDHLVVLGAAP